MSEKSNITIGTKLIVNSFDFKGTGVVQEIYPLPKAPGMDAEAGFVLSTDSKELMYFWEDEVEVVL